MLNSKSYFIAQMRRENPILSTRLLEFLKMLRTELLSINCSVTKKTKMALMMKTTMTTTTMMLTTLQSRCKQVCPETVLRNSRCRPIRCSSTSSHTYLEKWATSIWLPWRPPYLRRTRGSPGDFIYSSSSRRGTVSLRPSLKPVTPRRKYIATRRHSASRSSRWLPPMKTSRSITGQLFSRWFQEPAISISTTKPEWLRLSRAFTERRPLFERKLLPPTTLLLHSPPESTWPYLFVIFPVSVYYFSIFTVIYYIRVECVMASELYEKRRDFFWPDEIDWLKWILFLYNWRGFVENHLLLKADCMILKTFLFI